MGTYWNMVHEPMGTGVRSEDNREKDPIYGRMMYDKDDIIFIRSD